MLFWKVLAKKLRFFTRTRLVKMSMYWRQKKILKLFGQKMIFQNSIKKGPLREGSAPPPLNPLLFTTLQTFL